LEIKFIDLKRSYAKYGKELEEAVIQVLRSGIYLNGPFTKQIEDTLADFIGVKQAIGVSSGTEALYLILKALELPPNSYVLVPSFTFIATSEVVIRAGLVPWFVDVEEDTFGLSLENIKKAWDTLNLKGKKVSAIIVVSLFGIPARLEEISEFCKEKGIFLIEDICQALGAELKEKKVGSFGIASATSFYPTKPLSTCGDAGMVFTNSEKLAGKIRFLKEHGQTRPYYYEYHGVNGRIDEIHSAILSVKFKYFKDELKERRAIANTYYELLKDVKELTLPKPCEGAMPCWSLFTVRAKNRDELRSFLNENGIGTGIYYSYPLHLQPVYSNLGFKKGDLPVTERLAEEVISFPLYPGLKPEEIDYVVNKVKEFYSRKK